MAIEGSANVKQVLDAMSSSIAYKTNSFIVQRLIENIKKPGNNVMLSSNSFIAENIPDYESMLVQLYDKTFGLIEGVNDIPDDIKVLQASLLDSVHFGYNTMTGEYALYTMNTGLFEGTPVNFSEKVLTSIMSKNKVGEAKAYRVDIEYLYEGGDEGGFKYKLVENRKEKLDDETVLLVPFYSVYNLVDMIKTYLNQGCTLKTVQNVGGNPKVRCVSTVGATIAKYSPGCDLESRKPLFFAWTGFIYVPVLGAPNTTAGVTKINMFKLDEIRRITKASDLQKNGVRIIKNPVFEMVRENAIITQIMFLMSQDIEQFYHVFDALPRRAELLPEVGYEDFTKPILSSYLHSLKAGELNQIVKMLPNAKRQIADLGSVITTSEDTGSVPTGSELIELLRGNVCRILIRKKDYGLSTIMATNNPEILKKVYGDNYFKYYESFNARLGRALQDVEERDIEVLHALKDNGFEDIDPSDFFKYLLDEQGSLDVNTESYRNVVYKLYNKKQRKSAETSNILVRCIDAYLSKDGAEGYYRYVDPSKIISVKVL